MVSPARWGSQRSKHGKTAATFEHGEGGREGVLHLVCIEAELATGRLKRLKVVHLRLLVARVGDVANVQDSGGEAVELVDFLGSSMSGRRAFRPRREPQP